MKYVDVASPIRAGGVSLMAIACVADCMFPKPRPIMAPARRSTQLLPATLNIYILIAYKINAGYIIILAPFLSIKGPENGRETSAIMEYTRKNKLAAVTRLISVA